MGKVNTNELWTFDRAHCREQAQFNYDYNMSMLYKETIKKIIDAVAEGEFQVMLEASDVDAKLVEWLIQKDFSVYADTDFISNPGVLKRQETGWYVKNATKVQVRWM